MDYGVSVLKWSDQVLTLFFCSNCSCVLWRMCNPLPIETCVLSCVDQQVRGRTPFAADWYMLSSADARANASNVAAGGAIGAFNATTSYYGISLTPQCGPVVADDSWSPGQRSLNAMPWNDTLGPCMGITQDSVNARVVSEAWSDWHKDAFHAPRFSMQM